MTKFGDPVMSPSALLVLALGCGAVGGMASAEEGPSFDCGQVRADSVEALICEDAGLSALDRKLAQIYAAATEKAANEHPPMLMTEQRGWVKGRDDCWKSDDQWACVEESYRLRIAELQARYRLVPGKGPLSYTCDGDPTNQVIATFFETEPPTLIAERGDSVSLMVLQPSASGARYQGRNETFWERRGEALVIWGHGAPELRCKKAP